MRAATEVMGAARRETVALMRTAIVGEPTWLWMCSGGTSGDSHHQEDDSDCRLVV